MMIILFVSMNMMYMHQICEHCGIICLILMEENIKETKKLPEYILLQDISSWSEKKLAFDMALLLQVHVKKRNKTLALLH